MGSSCAGYEWYWSDCSGAIGVRLLHNGGKVGSGGWSQHRMCHPLPAAVTSGPGAVTTAFDHRVPIGQGKAWDLSGQAAQEHQDNGARGRTGARLLQHGGREGRLVSSVNSGLWLVSEPWQCFVQAHPLVREADPSLQEGRAMGVFTEISPWPSHLICSCDF